MFCDFSRSPYDVVSRMQNSKNKINYAHGMFLNNVSWIFHSIQIIPIVFLSLGKLVPSTNLNKTHEFSSYGIINSHFIHDFSKSSIILPNDFNKLRSITKGSMSRTIVVESRLRLSPQSRGVSVRASPFCASCYSLAWAAGRVQSAPSRDCDNLRCDRLPRRKQTNPRDTLSSESNRKSKLYLLSTSSN